MKRKIPMIVWADCPLEKFPPFLAASKASNLKNYERVGLATSCMRLANEMVRSAEVSKGILKNISICFYGCFGSSPNSLYFKLKYPMIKQIFFFDYCSWNPQIIIEKLANEAGWDPPKNVASDWHSDCIYTIFKEYMFQKMYRMGPLDAHLSNKIRHGIISREEGLYIMLKTKSYFKENILKTLDSIGLSHLASEIDVSCFDIKE